MKTVLLELHYPPVEPGHGLGNVQRAADLLPLGRCFVLDLAQESVADC